MPALARCLSLASLGGALCFSLTAPAFAADASCQPLSYVQKRVVQKAEVGVDALRDYVTITRRIHALDMMKIATSLDAWIVSAHCAGMSFDEKAVRQTIAALATPSVR